MRETCLGSTIPGFEPCVAYAEEREDDRGRRRPRGKQQPQQPLVVLGAIDRDVD